MNKITLIIALLLATTAGAQEKQYKVSAADLQAFRQYLAELPYKQVDLGIAFIDRITSHNEAEIRRVADSSRILADSLARIAPRRYPIAIDSNGVVDKATVERLVDSIKAARKTAK